MIKLTQILIGRSFLMFTIKEIKDITNATVVNGNENAYINKFNVSKKNHNENDFFIPIFWREDRQKYIIDAVKSNAIGYIYSYILSHLIFLV